MSLNDVSVNIHLKAIIIWLQMQKNVFESAFKLT